MKNFPITPATRLTLHFGLDKLLPFKGLLQNATQEFHPPQGGSGQLIRVDFEPLHCGKTSQKILPDASRKPSQGSPMSAAAQWVGRIFAVSLLMILPGVGGRWLDEKLGTEFLTLLGFGFGLVSGFVSLLVMVKATPVPRVRTDEEELENRKSEQR